MYLHMSFHMLEYFNMSKPKLNKIKVEVFYGSIFETSI